MTITPAQLEARRSHIGSSDMAAILGVDPWRNAHDVYLEKIGAVKDWTGNHATHLGDILEPAVLALAAEQLGPLEIPDTRAIPDCPIIKVNTDGLVVSSGEPVEAKTNSMTGRADDEWGEPDTDEVPLRVIVQAHCHMLAWDRDVCHVPALIGRRGFLLYRLRLNEDVAKAIKGVAELFWDFNVLAHVPPPIAPHIEVAKRMRRTAERVTAVDAALVSRWLEARDAKTKAEAAAESAQAAVLAAMGDGEAATVEGMGALTYFEQTRRGYTVEECSYRVLRHKPKGL